MEILHSIQSDASRSSYSSIATPTRNLSESDSLHFAPAPDTQTTPTNTSTGPSTGEPPNDHHHSPHVSHRTYIDPISGSPGSDRKERTDSVATKSDLESSENFESISYSDLHGSGVMVMQNGGTNSPLLSSLSPKQPLSLASVPSMTSESSMELPAVVVGGDHNQRDSLGRTGGVSSHTASRGSPASGGTPLNSLSSTTSPSVLSPQHVGTPDTGAKHRHNGEAGTSAVSSVAAHGKPAAAAGGGGERDTHLLKMTQELHSTSDSDVVATHLPKKSREFLSSGESDVVATHIQKKTRSSTKGSSASSSRGASGANTPRSQKSLQPKGVSSNPKHSPAARDTPPLAKTIKPPQNFQTAVIERLKSLESPEISLPSPLYSQETDHKPENEEEMDGEEEPSSMSSLYGPIATEEKVQSDTDVIKEAVKLTSPEAADSRLGRRRERTIVAKPGLDNNNLRMFFKKIIADDTSEILMNITWGVGNLPCAPSCEIEAGTIISDKAVYLLEVLDPKNHRSRPLSWGTENLPLAKITCCYHASLRSLSIGIFDQSLTVESFEKGLVKRFVFFPHTYEKLNMFVENLKAAFDAYKMPYEVVSPEQGFVSSTSKGLLILHPTTDDMSRLKESLVWASSRAKVGNAVSAFAKSDSSITSMVKFDSELRKMTSDAVAKFDLVQYVIVGELSCDNLPLSNGREHVQTRALILTNDTIYLCKEELDSWPHKNASIRSPPFPRCSVVDSHPIGRISGIKVCDKSHPIVSSTDPLYEFSITFEELDDIKLSPMLSAEWVLCVHDRQYLDQFLGCLTHLSNELQKENQKLVSIKHTSARLMMPLSPKPPKSVAMDTLHSARKDANTKIISTRGSNPCFVSSRVLYEFSIYTNYQRLKFFKRHVAQAEFLKSDEVPLSVFLAHCSSSHSDYVEIEVCVIISNYAIYLLSDADNIQQWVEMGGVFSFQRRNLLDRKNADVARCFYRLWFNEMKQVDVGVFYDSISVTDAKEPGSPRFTIHTENPSATLSFLTALSCVVELHDSAEEAAMDDLLEDYDLMVESVPTDASKLKTGQQQQQQQHHVEFVYHTGEKLDDLKRDMVHKSPAITKSIPWESAREALRILYQQVMLLVEELRIRDLLTSTFYPHLVFLTNFGIYVCPNEASEKCSPSVLDPSKLSVKKWCHIELIERVHVSSPMVSQYSLFNVTVYLRRIGRGSFSSEDSTSLSLLVQNSELLGNFLYHFELMYYEKCGKQVPITRD